MKKQIVAGVVAAAVATTGLAGAMAGPASAAALPTQKVAAAKSLTTATVVGKGASPQFFHAVAQAAANALAGAAALKTVQVTAKVVTTVKSSSSSESSSSSSGGPAVAANGGIPGDAQFDAAK